SSLGAGALASALAAAATGLAWSRCTCVKETASWNATANSARYEPNLDLDRKKPIGIRFALLAPAEPFRRRLREKEQCNIAHNLARFAIPLGCCRNSTSPAGRSAISGAASGGEGMLRAVSRGFRSCVVAQTHQPFANRALPGLSAATSCGICEARFPLKTL